MRKAVQEIGAPAAGFYTEEIRSPSTGSGQAAGRREGFALVTLDGHRATLASATIRSRFRVSRYGVDVAALEKIGVAALERAPASARLVVIDEIGKMELLSDRFQEAVLAALDGDRPVLASIMLSPHPFADALKARTDVRVIHLTPDGRERALGATVAALRAFLR